MFQPLMFQTTTQAGRVTDLYPSTFGPTPELTAILGSRRAARDVMSSTFA